MDVDPIKVDQKRLLSITIMKTKEIITGEIFIIPNTLITPKNLKFEEPRYNIYQTSSVNNIEFTDNCEFIGVLFTTPGNPDSNWIVNGIDGYKELKYWRPVCCYLPVELFDGKVEGDVVTFYLPIKSHPTHLTSGKINQPEGCNIPFGVEVNTSIKVTMTLAQTKHRYRNFGRFEEVLKKSGA